MLITDFFEPGFNQQKKNFKIFGTFTALDPRRGEKQEVDSLKLLHTQMGGKVRESEPETFSLNLSTWWVEL